MPTKDFQSIAIPIATSAGPFLATFSETGLAELEFPSNRRRSSTTRKPDGRISNWAELTRTALEAVLSGHEPEQFPPLDLSRGSPFQQQVWKALQEIPFGSTVAYGEIGARVGKAMASRAIGNACGANPIPVLIPCHRVVAKGGIGGFSAGLEWKRRLLEIEGTLPPAEATWQFDALCNG